MKDGILGHAKRKSSEAIVQVLFTWSLCTTMLSVLGPIHPQQQFAK